MWRGGARLTVDALRGEFGERLAALLQEADAHLHGVVRRLLQEQRQHLQRDDLVRLETVMFFNLTSYYFLL